MTRLDTPSQSATHEKTNHPGYARSCQECGRAFTAHIRAADFCGDPCRKTFNNRRMTRGATIYDLFMALRFQRALATKLGLWNLICRLASTWRTEDHAARDSRQSWQPPHKALSRLTWLHAVTTDIRRKSKP